MQRMFFADAMYKPLGDWDRKRSDSPLGLDVTPSRNIPVAEIIGNKFHDRRRAAPW
jgi:hypothetical protein